MTTVEKYFPILDELFASDMFIFLAVGFVLGFFIGIVVLRVIGRIVFAAVCAFALYAVCEGVLAGGAAVSWFSEIAALFAGTTSLGGFGGFIISMLAASLLRRK